MDDPLNRTYSALKLKHPADSAMSPALINAVNHPIRRFVLRVLGDSPMSPKEVFDMLSYSTGLSAVSYHVRVLGKQQVLECTRTGQVRGSIQHFYVSKVLDSELLQGVLEEAREFDDAFLKLKD
jgi:DNA-binding transcriptional ArsR family regulator